MAIPKQPRQTIYPISEFTALFVVWNLSKYLIQFGCLKPGM